MQVTLSLSSLWVFPGIYLALSALGVLYAWSSDEERTRVGLILTLLTIACMLAGSYACWRLA